MATDRDQGVISVSLADVNAKLVAQIGNLNHEIAMRDVLIETLQAQLAEARAAREKESTE